MINRLAKAQKGWIAKLILGLTAASFISLFGVSTYWGNASNNRNVIEVDGVEITQAEFSYLLDREMSSIRNLLGDEVQLTDEMRHSLTLAQAQKMVQDAIIDRTAQKYHVSFRPELIQAMIISQPTFHDETGNFNRDMFRQMLSQSGISEAEYVQALKRDLIRQLLAAQPAMGLKVPEVLKNAQAKVDNKRRTFKYINIKPEDMVVGRQITDDEVAQYYADFQSNFMEPERRDVSVLYLSVADIAGKIDIADEDIQAYYDDHKREYETPETRQILQMMFNDETEANKAFFRLQNGDDFYDIASELANQSKEDTDLGYAAEDELIAEVAQDVFALPLNGYIKPVQVGDMWQIMQVTDIKEGTKVDYQTAVQGITAELINERLYDEIYEVQTEIEDMLGAGTDLAVVAENLETAVLNVKGLADDGTADETPNALTETIKNRDFINEVFSYTLGETSQVFETDNGVAVVRVDNIAETHPKDVSEVREEIEKLWAMNEKTAIAQEKLNDVSHDLDNGDDLSDVAQRYELTVYKSQPITRNETFANISYADIREMFTEALDTPKQIQQGDGYVVAVAVEDYENSVPLSEAEMEIVERNALQSLTRDLSEAVLKSYADEYDINIEYKLMGLTDL